MSDLKNAPENSSEQTQDTHTPETLDIPTPKKKKKSRILRFFLWLFLIGTVVGVASAFALYKWAISDLPSFSKIADYRPAQVTTVLARDGSLIGQFYREKRFLIGLDEMPKHLPLAFLAVEDSEFYQHPGVNLMAIGRAFIANMQAGGISQGGSTITQQVVKRLMLTPEKSYERKLKEAILAYRLEQQLSKDEILTIYLNQIFLGSNSYGVEAAARTYFNKHAMDLSIAEAAMIAGLPQSPSANNPYRHPVAAKDRQEHVLRRMRDLGYISDEEFDKAFYEDLQYATMSGYMGREGGWYLEEVRRQLIDIFDNGNAARFGFDASMSGEDVVYEMGLTVHTSMDPIQQIAADKALRKGLEASTKRHGWQGELENISSAHFDSFLKENPLDLEKLEKKEWVKVLVTEVNSHGAKVAIGDYKGYIPVKTMGWARKPDPEKNGAYLKNSIKDARRVLEVGDIVWASFNPISEKEFAKIKKKSPKEAEKYIINVNQIEPTLVIPFALEQYPEVQGAVISMEAKTGDVVALVGGYEFGYHGSQFNRATQARRQPGSSFKPFVYSAAIDNGFNAASAIMDAPILEIDEATKEVWRPRNYDGAKFEGEIPLHLALARSKNLCTIRVIQEMGTAPIVQRAKDLGLSGEFLPILSLGLGVIEVLPLEFTSAYTAFVNQGKVAKPRFIQKIQGSWGNIIYEKESESYQAISPQNAYIMGKLLEGVVQYGSGRRAKVIDAAIGGKTGTTNNEIDAWFVGTSPYLVTSTYIGYDNIKPMGKGETGSAAALPVFVDYMQSVVDLYPKEELEVPDFIVTHKIGGYELPFVVGQEPPLTLVTEEGAVDTKQQLEDFLMQDF